MRRAKNADELSRQIDDLFVRIEKMQEAMELQSKQIASLRNAAVYFEESYSKALEKLKQDCHIKNLTDETI